MLAPQQMNKVVIAAPKQLMERIIKELHELKVLHIKDHKNNEYASIGNPFERASNISEALVKIRSLISFFNIKKEQYKFQHYNIDYKNIIKKVGGLQIELNSLSEELKKTESAIEKNKLLLNELDNFKGIDIPLEYFTNYKSIVYFIGNLKNIENFKNELNLITPKFKILKSREEKSDLSVLIVEVDKQKEASELLSKFKFSPLSIPSFEGIKGTAKQNLDKIEGSNSELLRKSDSIKNDIKKLGEENAEFLAASEFYLSGELEVAEAPLRLAETHNAFVISGYVPKENVNALENKIKRIDESIYTEFSELKRKGAPVKLDNPKPVNSFEFFLNMYTLPSYLELDPTFFVFLTFPILFGFILGDIGYGLFSLILFIILKKILPKAKFFFNILILSSISTIFFGFVFGEFFGFEEIGHFEIPHLISRSHDMMGLLMFAIVIGIIHINIGFILGFFNEKKSHGLVHAINAKLGWIVLQTGLGILFSYYLKLIKMPSYMAYAGFVILALSIIMIFKGEGIRGVLELPSIFSNILSYARLMAIGVTSVMFAAVVNEMSKKMLHSGGIMIIVGIVVLLIGHVINIAIGIFGSFLHPLRLHYVEFFSKFYHGGGEKYRPFGSRE